MLQNNIEFEIITENGNKFTEYFHENKIFVEGRKGKSYTLRIKNNTANRILAVPSVDGLSVLDGEKASHNSNGYVLDAYTTYNIEGWRISNDDVRKFFFTRHDKSYSEKTGQGQDNLGVIGLVCFREKIEYIGPQIIYHRYDYNWPSWNTKYYRDGYLGSGVKYGLNSTADCYSGEAIVRALNCTISNSVGSNQLQQQVEQSLGTGMGEKTESKVVSVDFKKETSPFATFTMYYYERKQLEKMGIMKKFEKYYVPKAK